MYPGGKANVNRKNVDLMIITIKNIVVYFYTIYPGLKV